MKNIGPLSVAGMILLALVVLAMLLINPGAYPAGALVYILFSMTATILVAYAAILPSARHGKNIDIFSPMFGIFASLLLGSALRSIYIIFAREAAVRNGYVFLRYPIEQPFADFLWFLLGILALVIGYNMTRFRLNLERLDFARSNYVSEGRLLLLSVALGAAGLYGIVAYVSVTGIDLSQGLAAASSKKALQFDSGNGMVYGAGWQTFLGQFSRYPFILITTLLLLRVIRPSLIWIALAVVFGFLSILIPILGSARAEIGLLMLAILIPLKYFNRLKLRNVIIPAVAFLLLFSAMSEWRQRNQLGVEESQSDPVGLIVASGNFFDSYRSALILERVPENVPFQAGKTYLGIFSFFIPRAVWPEKPNPALGPWVKDKVFEAQWVRNNGWPPGIIAEAYINFGYIGILFVPFLYGVFLRVMYNSFRPVLGQSVLATILYGSLFWPLVCSATMYNVALGLVGGFYDVVPLLAISLLIWKVPHPAAVRAAIGHSSRFATRPSPAGAGGSDPA